MIKLKKKQISNVVQTNAVAKQKEFIVDTELMLDVGQANEFKLACRRAGYTNADIKKMCEGNVLAQVLPVIRGNGQVTVIRHLINCDADPFVPQGWKGVEEHKKGGKLEWNPSKVSLYLSPNQQNDKVIGGNKLRKELECESVLNANVLDHLLANQHLIPEEWKGKCIFFWGTIYCLADGILCVRYLYFIDGRWRWGYGWLVSGWDVSSPAARLAS